MNLFDLLLLLEARARIPEQTQGFEAIWPYTVDLSHKIYEIEDINAPYKRLDDPIPLRSEVREWLEERHGPGDSWPFNPDEQWGRYGNAFGFKTAKAADEFKLRWH